ncbi:MAG: thiamine diphosphokinase [Armatimonadetes bacterium]|nr:thiamine diphosphokinase [Armatimonadota bacterium]
MTETENPGCLIVCNGVFPSEARILAEVEKAGLIACADGGAEKLLRLGIAPHYIVGDQDSVTPDALASVPSERVVLAWDQEYTDFDKTVRFVLDLGYSDIRVVGATGGRVDHTVGNLGVLRKYHRRARIALVDDDCWIVVPDRSLTFPAEAGQKVSLVPLGRAGSVSTEGLKWPLRDDCLELGVRDGTSNEAVSSPVTVTVEDGFLAVCVFHAG